MGINKINIIKSIDSTIGRLACTFSTSRYRNTIVADSVRKILLIRPGGIGDAVLLLPLIIFLKQKFSYLEIDILAEIRNEAIFHLSKEVNKVYRYDEIKDFFKAIKGRYDVVIDTEQWHRLSALVARLTNAPICIGYATNSRKKMFTHPIPYSHEDYERDSFFNLFTVFKIEKIVENHKPILSIPVQISEKVKGLLRSLLSLKIIVLFPGGSIKEKRWDCDKFRVMAENLVRCGYGVVIVGGKEDVRDGLAIESGLSNVVNLCGEISLTETASVLQEAELLITGDSGIMHIANALGKKIVALFGPGNVKKWAPRGQNARIITKNLKCSPCSKFGYTPSCKYDLACMKQITAQEVYAKAIELLER